jgi:hypothetical protein
MTEGIDWEPIRIDLGFGSLKEMWETLYDKDNHKTNSLSKMAKYLGVSTRTILIQLKRFGIARRPASTHPPSYKGHRCVAAQKLLQRKHILKDLTVDQIVERFGLKDKYQFYNIARWHSLEYKRRKTFKKNK